jgi:hypothetical protein
MINRVQDAIDDSRSFLEDLPADVRESVNDGLAIDLAGRSTFQQTQVRAHASGRLSTAEVAVVLTALGEVGSASNGGWAAGTDLTTKFVVTKTLVLLQIQPQLGARGSA